MTKQNNKKDLLFSPDTFLKCLIIVLAIALFTVLTVWIFNESGKSRAVNEHSEFIHTFLKFILLLIFISLFSIVGASVLSIWVEKPFHRLMEDVYDIGRGNFSIRLKSQKNPIMQRLARLIHYMADEMDRLKNVNVHGLVSEKNKTEALLRNIADGVIVTDMNAHILVMNRVVEKWFGFSEKQFLSKPISDCFRNQKIRDIFQDIIQGKSETKSEFEYKIIDSSSPHILQAVAARVNDESNQPIGVIAVLRDVTREREADRVKTELVSMVAHELRSPLTSIYGFSELLIQMDSKDTKLHEYASVIMEESSRLTDFVSKFLDLSRLESRRMEVRKIPFDLKEIVNRLLESQKGVTEQHHIQIITDYPTPMPLVLGDQDLIEQVLLNLLSNALKYSPDHSKVGIEVKNESGHLLVHVIDNGQGIPKEALPNIFNKFYRVYNKESEDEVEGSGLGLALVKKIIEEHGGLIRVQSRLAIGSVFSFTIPKYQESNDNESLRHEKSIDKKIITD